MSEEWPINFGMYQDSLVVRSDESDEQAFKDKVLKAVNAVAENLSGPRVPGGSNRNGRTIEGSPRQTKPIQP